MKNILLFIVLLPGWAAAQPTISASEWMARYNPADTIAEIHTADSLVDVMRHLGKQHSFAQLATAIEVCIEKGSTSANMAALLAGWLNEGHPVYEEKSYTETMQFRAYLLYALSFFPPTPELHKYLVYELNFSDNKNIQGAAVYTARLFTGDSILLALANKYSDGLFNIPVSFTSHDVLYTSKQVTTLQQQAVATATLLRQPGKTQHSCCSKGNSQPGNPLTAKLINARERKAIKQDVTFYDQYGKRVTFGSLKSRPFVLTFFYTSCSNQNKCAGLIQELCTLQRRLETEDPGAVGIYPVTYDSYIDKPDVLKKFGDAYGFSFTAYHKFMAPQNELEKQKLFRALGIKVGYGNGIVTQHATQVFIFDKRGRVAMQIDNEVYSTEMILRTLAALKHE